MDVIEFVNKYHGKKVDFDGAYGAQCVDLFRQYCKDVLRAGHTGAVEGAKDLYLNYANLPAECKYFDRISDTKPRIGDVCVWGATTTNKYGHVAICLGMDEDSGFILVFEQDGFKQDGAKISTRLTKNLLGVLRPVDNTIYKK